MHTCSPSTCGAEAGESVEPGRWRLQWGEITPLHSSLVTERDSISKTKTKSHKTNSCHENSLAITRTAWGKRPPWSIISHLISPLGTWELWPLTEKKFTSHQSRPGMVAHAYNPSTLGGQGGWIIWGLEFKTSWVNMVKLCLYKKYKN